MKNNNKCWCGNTKLLYFSEEYYYCDCCDTLVADQREINDEIGANGLVSYYGEKYWHECQYEMGLPDIESRARKDLCERVVYWLRVLLKYKLPPGNSLEIGCAHGAFVRILQEIGFNATGLELNPWVADFAKKRFDITVLKGVLEEQEYTSEVQDIIVMMDVIEHLQNPSQTIKECWRLLKPNGILIIQTPCFPGQKVNYSDWQDSSSPFLNVLRDKSHLFLFSEKSIQQLLKGESFNKLIFEPAIFSQYDMLLVACKGELTEINSLEKIDTYCEKHPETACVQGLLDLYNKQEQTVENLVQSEKDRADRLQVIERVGKELQQERINYDRIKSEKDKLQMEMNLQSEYTSKLESQLSGVKRDVEMLEKRLVNRIYSFVKNLIRNTAGDV